MSKVFRIVRRCIVTSILLVSGFAFAQSQDAQFTDVEIRVIRPKYFQKSSRLEVGAGIAAVMNKSYTYTYLPQFKLGLHINEWLELFGEAGVGLTINKSDCTELGSKFSIEPVVDEFEQVFGGNIAITPIYGKYQLSSGDVVYFDWFLLGGGGMANMKRRYQGCKPIGVGEPTIPPLMYSPVQFNFGTGQRFFLNKSSSLNWYLRDFIVGGPTGGLYQNVTLSFGASYYL